MHNRNTCSFKTWLTDWKENLNKNTWSMLIKDAVKRYRNIICVFTFHFWFLHWWLLFHSLHVAPNPTPDATCLCNCVTCIYDWDWEVLCWMEPEQKTLLHAFNFVDLLVSKCFDKRENSKNKKKIMSNNCYLKKNIRLVQNADAFYKNSFWNISYKMSA